MFRVCKIFWLETGHFLSSPNNSSNCRIPHGHSRKVEIIVAAKELDRDNMVCDFQVFKTAFGEFLDSFDHAMLINTDSPHYEYFKNNFDRIIGFEGKDPTSEAVSEMIFKHIEKSLKNQKIFTNKDGNEYTLSKHAYLERVRVWETVTCWAEYSLT
ncbi:MAG: 6-carboxytetrahydropterin synthase [bacterium]|nr:6-carboxytetrahydropterin synthase [bacterium]